MKLRTFDMDRKQFSEFLEDKFTSGCTALGLALGAELGLFDQILHMDMPFTSQGLAEAGGFKERYIREWLGAMAISKVLDYSPKTHSYSVSKEKLIVLTKTSRAWMPGLLPIFGQRHELLKKTIMKNGPSGICMSETPQLGIWLDGCRKSYFPSVVDDVVLKIPGLKKKLESGICVADVACGIGTMTFLLATRFPRSTFWGLDIDDNLLDIARQRLDEKGVQNVVFQKADAQNISNFLVSKFDYVLTYDFIHDLPNPGKALKEMYKMLKQGGIYSMVEPNVASALKENLNDPNAASVYIMSLYWCLPHSLSIPGGEGWGRTLGEEKGKALLKEALFNDFKVINGEMNHFICRK